jgi:DNA-binding NarL/FixJ family response regulator
MTEPVRVSIIHRNRLFRECLVGALGAMENYDVTELDHSVSDLLACIDHASPHLVLLDLNLPEPSSLEITRSIRQRLCSAKLVLLARRDDLEKVFAAVAEGAHACVLEESSLEELQHALREVLRGQVFCSPQMVYSMFHALARGNRPPAWADRVDTVGLTPRELDILRLVAGQMSNKAIAKHLGLSLYTVKNHVHNIVEKLQVEGRFAAVDYARRHYWLSDGTHGLESGQR